MFRNISIRAIAVLFAIAMVFCNPVSVHAFKIVDEISYKLTVTKYYDKAFEVLALVNEKRAEEKLSPLKMDVELLEAAMLRATETAVIFEHIRPNGTACFTANDKMNAENIADGYSSPAIVVNGWMGSEGHRENILTKSFKSIGIGVVNYNGIMHWVQCFSISDAKQASVKPNEKQTYELDIDETFCKSLGINISTLPKSLSKKIDDEGVTYSVGTIFRLFNSKTGEHHYTNSMVERNDLFDSGWNYEGVGWNSPEKSSVPVYRMFNPATGDHHYTMSENEKNDLVAKHWNYEGIGWYSDENKTVPMYRLFNPTALVGSHHYTKNAAERDNLKNSGWIDEGIAWYGL